ncbi:RNA polymerase sigma factor [Chitinophaga filiformis]|uniref:RNA polymerase sigma-70 factor, ECF subfamily n=1 Tax=Chitinophaga filiformis TaxID=104663 RepID=A0A1G7MFR5_CHIFI|nr:sigma-70 family RNA polymerase sigma factor [Chitinophaga filiformis]SDF60541.1 RNA polymerase sigma-70 factor, ECF subfamily [Chitinophaga filiformis]
MELQSSGNKRHEHVVKLDNKTFSSIYENYHKKLFGYAYKILKLEHEAKDIVQEIFTNIWQEGIRGHSGPINIKPYLYQSVRNKIIDLARKNKNVQAYFEEQRTKMVTSHLSADKPILTEEVISIIEGEFANLTPRRRQVLTMFVEENMSYREIAKELGISEGTVLSVIRAARDIVRPRIRRSLDLSILYIILNSIK